MELTGVIGIVAGIFTAVSLLPQIIKIIKEKKVEELSATMFITLITGLLLWTYYRILQKDMPIIVTNSFSVLLNIFAYFSSYLHTFLQIQIS